MLLKLDEAIVRRWLKISRIALIVPRANIRGARPYFPQFTESLGVAYLASMVEKEGFSVDIYDMEAFNLTVMDVIEKITKHDYSVVGISTSSELIFWDSMKIARLLRRNRVLSHITLGGHLVTNIHEKVLKNFEFIDSVVRGDGEYTFLELCKAIRDDTDLNQVKGLSFRSKNATFINQDNFVIKDLDALPFPHRYNIKKIVAADQVVHVSSSRGCYGRCSFCLLNSFSKVWRCRSPENVVDEIEHLNREYGATKFRFVDEDFFGHCSKGYDRAIELCDELDGRKLGIKFKILCRADDVQYDLFRRLKAGGLYRVSIGIESVNIRQLRLYNKGISLKDIKQCLRSLRRLGISANLSFIMFDPFINLKEVERNLDFIKKNKDFFEYRRIYTKLRPVNGTAIIQTLRNKQVLTKRDLVGYDFDFKDKKAKSLYRIVEIYQDIMHTVDERINSIKDEYHNLVAFSNLDGRRFDVDTSIATRIKDIESRVFDMWIYLVGFAISFLKKEYDTADICPIPKDTQRRVDLLLREIEDVRLHNYMGMNDVLTREFIDRS